MPKYRYRAVGASGSGSRRGVVEAPSLQAASELLKEEGLWLTDLTDDAQSLWRRDVQLGGPRIKTQDFTVFCRQLATLYRSGITLVEALRILSEQSESKAFRKVVKAMHEDVQAGSQLSDAAMRFPTVFSHVFINMVRAGESSGTLDEILLRLALFSEKQYYTREKVKSAMVYPIIMGIATIIVVIILLTFVVPRMIANFQQMGMQLPLPTRVVIYISDWMQQYFYVIPPVLLIPPLLVKLLGRIPVWRYRIDWLKLRLPIFGQLLHKQALARFSRTFSSLFAAAIPMMQMLHIVAGVVGNEAIARSIREAREGVREGGSVVEPLRNSKLFPPMVVQMMTVGDQTGALDTMLDKVADYYESDVDQMADRLKAMLEPVMILILAVIVGGIVLAVMLPSFALIGNLGSSS